MLFWIICAVIALAVAALVARPLLGADADSAAAGPDRTEVDIYRDQMAEIERDIARGVLSGDEAERTRTEVARRLLAADSAARARPAGSGAAPRRLTLAVAGLAVALIAAGGLGLYARLGVADASGPYPDLPRQARIARSEEIRAGRPGQAEAMAARIAEQPPVVPEGEVADLLEELRSAVPQRPEDPEGWLWLAQTEARLGNWPAAVAAMERVVGLMPPGSEAALTARVDLLDLMVTAVGGYVSPEAEALAETIYDADPDNASARAYLGLLYFETDRPDIAFRLWRPVAETAPADSRPGRIARGFIADAAFRAGVEYALPAGPAAPAERGPGAADMAAAADMDPDARAAMIRGMVEGLEARLADEGGSSTDWARLITSLAVLGETERAASIAAEARSLFARMPNDLARIEAAAAQAGLAPE